MSLLDSGTIYFDTNAWIYLIEKIEPFATLLRPVVEAADNFHVRIITSELSVMEVLVRPFAEGHEVAAQTFLNVLQTSAQLAVEPVSRQVLIEAARLRATLQFKPPDAIHLATAKLSACKSILTNDARWRAFPDIPVLLLSDLEEQRRRALDPLSQ